MTIGGVPFSLALLAGGLATLNPCGFPLLPAFLSFYVGAGEAQLPRVSTRVGQGLVVGLLVTAGFLGLFTLIGLPVTLGATAVARALPWTGIGLGIALVGFGLLTLGGRSVRWPATPPMAVGRGRRARTIVLFGASYGLASLGCTLPVFLTLIGSSVGAGPTVASIVAFAAYGCGMAVVLMALSVAASLARQGLARRLRRLLPHIHRVTGGLLVLAGGYLAYYWWRIRFGSRATLASDPVVGRVVRYTARLTASAEGAGWRLMVVAATVVAASAAVAWWPRRRRRRPRTVAALPVLSLFVVLVLLVLVAACSSGSQPAERSDPSGSGRASAMPGEERARLRTPGAPTTLSDLESVDQLAKLFDEHQDVPRLVLLLSPT